MMTKGMYVFALILTFTVCVQSHRHENRPHGGRDHGEWLPTDHHPPLQPPDDADSEESSKDMMRRENEDDDDEGSTISLPCIIAFGVGSVAVVVVAVVIGVYVAKKRKLLSKVDADSRKTQVVYTIDPPPYVSKTGKMVKDAERTESFESRGETKDLLPFDDVPPTPGQPPAYSCILPNAPPPPYEK